MISFGHFLREALSLSKRAALAAAAQRARSPQEDEPVKKSEGQVFHKDIGIPSGIPGPPLSLRLQYGSHAQSEARKEMQQGHLESLPKFLPAYQLVEVEVVRKAITKWVVRVERPNGWVLVLVVQPDGFVRTVWCNHTSDTHMTLKRHLYTSPASYRP